jgi:fucose 4-O-acetylase-like acetyltransferase
VLIIIKKRIVWIDNIKGFAMLLIILGHSFPPDTLKIWVYSFHLPLFFFVSGYLFKKRPLDETIKRKTKSLLIPYFVTALLSLPVGYLILRVIGKSATELFYDFFYLNGSVGWNVPIWFLVVLFWIEIIFAIIYSLNVSELLVIALTLVAGYLTYTNKIFIPFGLNIAIWLLPFYQIGHVFKELKVIEKIGKIETKILIPVGVMLIFACGVFGNLFTQTVPEPYHAHLGNYIIYFTVALVGILGSICFFIKIKRINILNTISKNSLFILCTQYFYFWTIRFISLKFLNYKLVQTNYRNSMIIFLACLFCYSFYFYIKNKIKVSVKTPKS